MRAGLLVCTLASALLAAPADARGLRVLIGTDVSRAAVPTMSPKLWYRLVAQWVGQKAIPFNGKPTLDDCARAKARYMVYAPFELKPELPGAMHQDDRVAALTHVTVLGCATKTTIFDQVIEFSSNPISTSNPADAWESPISQTLRKHRIAFLKQKR